MKDNVNSLDELNKGACMGIDAILYILDKVENKNLKKLLEKDYQVIIIDNLYNSKLDVLDRIKKITSKDVKFYQGDVQDLTL